MAQGDSVVGICNAALIALGEDVIASLTEATKRATLCAAKYDQVRREVLRKHGWGCAKRLANLPASATPPLHSYQAAFPLPADCLRVLELPDYDPPTDWEIMDGAILADADAPLAVIYIYDLQDPVRFDALLAKVLGLSLAAEICEPLTQNTERLKTVVARLNDALNDAKLTSSVEASSKEFDDDVLLRSRR